MTVLFEEGREFSERRPLGMLARILQRLHIDGPLFAGLLALCAYGMFVLYSASGQDDALVLRQTVRLCAGFVALLLIAQLPPSLLRAWSPWIFLVGVVLLALVLELGYIGKGAQRWLDLGVVRFQPSEIMKLAVPMTAAWYLHSRALPPRFTHLVVLGLIAVVPSAMVAVQPDLGTALLIGSAGVITIFIAGIQFRWIIAIAVLLGSLAPVLWFEMHGYQRDRVLTFLDPQRDPLGAGYHIIQSTIAIGSGGVFGKGWLNGSQAQLDFLPEPDTDFIFAVLGEELGLMGALTLLVIYAFIVLRGLYIASQAQDTFSRLLAGCLSLTFFVYVFVNTGMVTGLLPVVGVPLPLVSYGGTSMVTILAGFGMLMSVHTHRKLLAA
jgi:rod shape determining protein RodA